MRIRKRFPDCGACARRGRREGERWGHRARAERGRWEGPIVNWDEGEGLGCARVPCAGGRRRAAPGGASGHGRGASASRPRHLARSRAASAGASASARTYTHARAPCARTVDYRGCFFPGVRQLTALAPPSATSQPSADDDLYSGFNDTGGEAYHAPAPAMGYGASAPMGTAMGAGAPPPGTARPMTSNKAAGYSSAMGGAGGRGALDPAGTGTAGGAAPVQRQREHGPDFECKAAELKVHELLEESATMSASGDLTGALERAKEAGRRERALCKLREGYDMGDQINVDLTFAVCFNLGLQLQKNRLYPEAMNAYMQVVKNKAFAHAGRLRVNMGNIYFEQEKYPQAIKNYRMALDQIPNACKEARFRVMRNIGLAFVRLGNYQDAVNAFESIMEGAPDYPTAFNLVVCYFAMGSSDNMKKSFSRLMAIRQYDQQEEEDEAEGVATAGAVAAAGAAGGSAGAVLAQAADSDRLRDELRERKRVSDRYVSMAARLIAPAIAGDVFEGFSYCAEALNSQGLTAAANEVEMHKATAFLALREFEKAIAVLKGFELKEQHLKARAATNLSFIYFLEGDLDNAMEYADMAVANDRYNASAHVNRGNCLYGRGDYEGARAAYQEAVSAEADCVEAIYNLGMANRALGQYGDALQAFKKLNGIVPENQEVIFQIASCYDATGNYRQSIKTMEYLNSRVVNDPGVLARLGSTHAKYGDEAKALHYYREAHRVFPVNMDVISWLGAFHVKSEVYEEAMPYFDLAARIQPAEVKWQLMVASCLRRVGRYPEALEKYKKIHVNHPDDVECLRYLVHICTDMGRKDDVQEYMVKLRKAERAAAHEAPVMPDMNDGVADSGGGVIGRRMGGSAQRPTIAVGGKMGPAGAAAMDISPPSPLQVAATAPLRKANKVASGAKVRALDLSPSRARPS